MDVGFVLFPPPLEALCGSACRRLLGLTLKLFNLFSFNDGGRSVSPNTVCVLFFFRCVSIVAWGRQGTRNVR